MTIPGTSSNIASGDAYVGVQAQNVEGGIDYTTVVYGNQHFNVSSTAPPEEKYRAGIRNLTSHKSAKARDLIWEAMTEEFETAEVRFHWLVAMLSGRTIRQFSPEELRQLDSVRDRSPQEANDPWADGSHVVFRLLESVGLLTADPRPDVSTVLGEFEKLDVRQRDMLLPHIELFLEGPLKDDTWKRQRGQAERERLKNDRPNRAWMFFQPVPVRPRVSKAQPPFTRLRERFRAWGATVIFAVAAGYFGWVLILNGPVLGMLAYAIGLVGGGAAAVTGLKLRFLAKRRRMKEERLRAPGASAFRPPRGGFADKVDALFRHYSAKYVPKAERAAWEAATAGIRAFDRDEIVTEYREQRIPAERAAWLIRYRIRQSRDRWRNGSMYHYQKELRPEPGTLKVFQTGSAVSILGLLGTILAFRAHPLADAATVLATLVSGVCAWGSWHPIYLERERYAADEREAEERFKDSEAEFRRWTRVLERRPSDAEIAEWLECDRTVLLGQAIDHYKLARHQVRAHAFLEAPGKKARRARTLNGPTRYSRYTLIVFLLTSDGVRQMTADLGFLALTLHLGDRISFRYDAVASAHVILTPGGTSHVRQEFRLTLVNGEPITVIVSDVNATEIEQGEDETSLTEAALDAASVVNTLHLLEGIAAEGKTWLRGQSLASAAW